TSITRTVVPKALAAIRAGGCGHPVRVLGLQDPEVAAQARDVPDHPRDLRDRVPELGLQPQRAGVPHAGHRADRALPARGGGLTARALRRRGLARAAPGRRRNWRRLAFSACWA